MSIHFWFVHLYFSLGIIIALFLMYCLRIPYVNIMCFNKTHFLLPPLYLFLHFTKHQPPNLVCSLINSLSPLVLPVYAWV